MLKSYEKFRFSDENKNNEFFAEVNWNSKDPKSNECKLIRFTFPNGEQSTIRRENLISVLFTFGTGEQQQKMIPQTITEHRYIKTVLGIKAKKDIKAGEMINVPVELKLPPIEQEVIAELDRHYQNKRR